MKRRTPLKRDTPKSRAFAKKRGSLTRTGLQKKRARIKPVNKERKKKRAEEGKVYGPYHAFVSSLPCLISDADCFGKVVGHHVTTVAAGGEDRGNEVPLCVFHHASVHSYGRKTFGKSYGINLKREAREIERMYPGTPHDSTDP